jgi:hypothetical protein
VIAPKSAKPTMKPIALVTVKVRLRKSSSGTTGSAARPSTSTNAPRSATPSTSSPTIWLEPHAHVVPPRLVKSTNADSPPASNAAPR